MRRAATLALVTGSVLLGAGAFLPVTAVRVTLVPPDPSASFFVSDIMYGVVACALDDGDARAAGGEVIPGVGMATWPARLILLAALAASCLVAMRRPLPATIACAVLAGSIVWLFFEIPAAPPPTWAGHPPLSATAAPPASALEAWPVWGALAAGTLLLAAAAWLRPRLASAPA